MKKDIFICPETGGTLKLFVENKVHGEIDSGYFQNSQGTKYLLKNGVPDFTYPPELSGRQKEQYKYYEENAEAYDELQGLTFAIQNEDEAAVRKDMVKSLDLRKNFKVLELSCGTGRDSENIAAQLDKNGELFVQDLSGAMLRQCKMKLEKLTVPVEYVVGNASYLPYPDHYFDAVFSFGGLNVFEDPKRALKEMVRVTKPNGKIVVGDESLPVWLYDTEFGRTLLNANPLFKHNVPFDLIPVEARNVSVKWIIGGVYYLISFTVGEGEPKGNFDLKIPGRRGGTLRTRYHGQLEGVTEETKKLVLEAAAKNKKSIHDWLDQALRAAAEKSLT